MIGLIVAAHGSYGPEAVHAAEMIFGKQSQVVAVNFVPGENQDTLMGKYESALKELGNVDGVVFLCDLFGGSPFNAASRVAAQRDDMDVVSGLNLPMLLEVYAARLAGSLEEVVNTALRAGQSGIQSLKNLKIADEEDL